MKKTKISATRKIPDVSIEYAYLKFKIYQEEKGNSPYTLDFYDRFYKKFCSFLQDFLGSSAKNLSISTLYKEGLQLEFMQSLGNVSQQTINSYLRGFRAFGNYCEEIGLIDNFSCSIKEVEPPIKSVYTTKELKKLLIRPDINNFVEFRTYTVINLLLATGARSNTIINLQIKDVDLDEGYIMFNTTKSHRVVRIGLERRAKSILAEYISVWRSEEDTDPEDYLFCNCYGEKLTRSGLSTSITIYCKKHGVEKYSIHLFRHTFAKNWITSGGDIISLAQVLTHRRLDMVKRYANLYGNDVKEKIEQHSTLSQIRATSGQTIKGKKTSSS